MNKHAIYIWENADKNICMKYYYYYYLNYLERSNSCPHVCCNIHNILAIVPSGLLQEIWIPNRTHDFVHKQAHRNMSYIDRMNVKQ